MNNLVLLALSILICLLAGFIGSFFTITGPGSWYANIEKPSFNPPNWVFAPVWTALFILMGIALFLVWKQGFANPQVKTALLIFAVQFILNILWSAFFFGLKSPLLAFIEIIVLWAFILLTIINFYNLSKPAGFLLIPYILWVTFAAALNFAIFWLNRA
ncbi:MAG TPA: TspO/MBR family protein [Candidatus Nanoarchaeia archaeon]|nr:TspO/MBR family protein [Candidatus Nanoarchaeia archaeon]